MRYEDRDRVRTWVEERSEEVPPAEEIQFTKVRLQPSRNGEIDIVFDISWSESWRFEDRSWDAAWVFIKASDPDVGWRPVHISSAAGVSRAPRSATITPAEDGMGAFIFRSAKHTGYGPVRFKNVSLRLARGSLPTTEDETFTLALCGLHMVYIPAGPFWAGDPVPYRSGAPESCFFDSSVPEGEKNRAYYVDSEAEIQVAPEGDDKTLYYRRSAYGGDRGGPIPEAYPKGHQAFYVMRSQVTQGDYSQFLNLVDYYSVNIHYQWGAGSYRFTIWSTQVNPSIANRPRRPCNWLSWADATAYACWAGLRPMTELEFEKASRGPADPVTGEFAWGDRDCDIVNVILGQESTNEERACGNCNVDNANRVLQGGDGGSGPIRADAFLSWHSPPAEVIYMGQRTDFRIGHGGIPELPAPPDAEVLRQWTGASYYGAMGLSGNLWELCVTVGSPEGRAFNGRNGNGVLVNGAPPRELGWPGIDGRGNGFRGGSWYTEKSKARLADRGNAGGWPNFVFRSLDVGFRCVRSAPESAG